MTNSDLVIRVEGLGKKYSLHHEQLKPSTHLRDVLVKRANAVGKLLNPFTLVGQFSKANRDSAEQRWNSEEEFWALKDVNFEIHRGERVGIIGRNGAGKSTLLKILSRITEPTTGRVEILGRVASLLEVGTGFHPELTGRENIYLNGAILGMMRQEIKSKFDEIVDFAEVEKFLDTPVKRYSSGMYVRLAFAVAAHLEPEILIVDEVLAVGDANFQKKCMGKLKDVSSGEGRTVIFVSHNMRAVETLCNTGLLIEKGMVACFSRDLKSIIQRYENPSVEAIKEQSSQSLSRSGFIFHAPILGNSESRSSSLMLSQNPEYVLINVQRSTSDVDLSIGFSISRQDVEMSLIQSFNVDHGVIGSSFSHECNEVTYQIPLNLNGFVDGNYTLEVIAGVHNQGWIIQPGENILTAQFTLRLSREDGSINFQQTTRNTVLMPVLPWANMQ